LGGNATGLVIHDLDADGRFRIKLLPALAADFPEFASALLIVWTARANDLIIAVTLGDKESP
jgi:hypothetical protein